MRAIVHTTEDLDHLLIAMASDAVDVEVAFDFVRSPDALLDRLERSAAVGWMPDLVIVHSDGQGAGLAALAAVDGDPVFWTTPTAVLATVPTDDERVLAYANGARWYRQMPDRFSTMVKLVARFDIWAEQANDPGTDGVIDRAAGDLIDEIETYLMGQD